MILVMCHRQMDEVCCLDRWGWRTRALIPAEMWGAIHQGRSGLQTTINSKGETLAEKIHHLREDGGGGSPLLARLADPLYQLGLTPDPPPSGPRSSEPLHGVVCRWAGEREMEEGESRRGGEERR